jgi:peptide/nickel transport system substrate-binding protein
LFKVDLASTEWVTYSEERTKDAYPVFQLGWFPDYPDADNYLAPFFSANSFLYQHIDTLPGAQEIFDAITAEQGQTDVAARTKQIEDLQTLLADKFMPTLPLLTGKQIAAAVTGVGGVQDTLDASFQFRFAVLTLG